MSNETPFTETNLLLAYMKGNYQEVFNIMNDMSDVEKVMLIDELKGLVDYMEEHR